MTVESVKNKIAKLRQENCTEPHHGLWIAQRSNPLMLDYDLASVQFPTHWYEVMLYDGSGHDKVLWSFFGGEGVEVRWGRRMDEFIIVNY